MTSSLTILGLGPGNPAQRTLEAVEALASASRILLRTGIHPGLQDLLSDVRVSTCDDLYETGRSFDGVYEAIVNRVIGQAGEGDLVFAVPGHPLIGERTVSTILQRAEASGIPVRIVAGVSALDALASALRIDLMADEAQIIDATELQRFIERDPFNGSLPDVSPLRPILLAQIYSATVASAAKLALARIFPDDHSVLIAVALGVAGEERIERRQLFELDRIAVDHLTSVWIPPLMELDATRWPVTLYRIAARLRAPDGCPWDRKQTHQSLRGSAIEEAYEVAAAIDEGDPHHLAEELGDLLLHVAMQAQIGEESGDFSIGDVLDHVNRKLVRRHPHVFGEATAGTPDAVVQTWNEVKAGERAARGLPPVIEEPDPYDRLPRSMPVLHRVARVSAKDANPNVSSVGQDDLGDELLRVVRQIAASGLDPEQELERAYRRGAKEHSIQPSN
jgi:tetrapyrrole methylase family protein/MazG family protein